MSSSINPCSAYAPLLSALGVASALSLTAIGAAYGTAKSAMGIIHISVMRPDLMMRCSLPVIMAGIVGLYGLILCIFLQGVFTNDRAFNIAQASLNLAAGLCVGLSGTACGIAIGIVGDAGVRGVAQQPRLFVGMLLILIFAEVLGLYGMILGMLLIQKESVPCPISA